MFIRHVPTGTDRPHRQIFLLLVLPETVGTITSHGKIQGIPIIIHIRTRNIVRQRVIQRFRQRGSRTRIPVQRVISIRTRSRTQRHIHERQAPLRHITIIRLRIRFMLITTQLTPNHHIHGVTAKILYIFKLSSPAIIESFILIHVQLASIGQRRNFEIRVKHIVFAIIIPTDSGNVMSPFRKPRLPERRNRTSPQSGRENKTIQNSPACINTQIQTSTPIFIPGIFQFIQNIIIIPVVSASIIKQAPVLLVTSNSPVGIDSIIERVHPIGKSLCLRVRAG